MAESSRTYLGSERWVSLNISQLQGAMFRSKTKRPDGKLSQYSRFEKKN